MVTINLTADTARIILQVSNVSGNGGNGLYMHVYSLYSLERFAIALGANTSAYPARYDEYTIPTSELKELGELFTMYTVHDNDEGTGRPIDTGMLQLIRDNPTLVPVTIAPEDTDPTLIVFNP